MKNTPDRRLSLMNSCSFHNRWYSIIRKAYLFYFFLYKRVLMHGHLFNYHLLKFTNFG